MTSFQFQALLQLLRSGAAPEGMTIAERRAAEEMMAGQTPLPENVYVEEVTAVSLPALLIAAAGTRDERVILYFHGGGYCVGSPLTHRDFAWRLSAASAARVLLLDYRRAPEHPFPTAVDDAVMAYRWLLDQGIDPAHLTLAGDSAGGGLALATMVRLRDEGDRLPAAAVLISPWVDLALTGESLCSKAAEDLVLTLAQLQEFADLYLGETDPRTPLASPLYADLSGLPPLLIQAGTAEILLDDAARLAERAGDAGVDVTLDIWPEMIHVWQGFAGFLPEAQTAVTQIGAFIRARAG